MKTLHLFLLMIVCLVPCLKAAEHDKSHLLLELGGYCTNLNRRLTADSDYVNKVSSLEAYFRVHPVFRLSNKLNFEPSLGAILPGYSSPDGTTRTLVFHIDLDLGLKLKEWLTLRLGPGLQVGMLNSKGAGVELNNGTDRSTFYTPGESVNYFILTSDAGLTIQISKRLNLLLDTYVMNLASKARRTVEISATLGFRI
mgnify:CR=1 FL=1